MAAAPSTLSLYLSFIIVTTLLLLSAVIVAVGVVNVVALLHAPVVAVVGLALLN